MVHSESKPVSVTVDWREIVHVQVHRHRSRTDAISRAPFPAQHPATSFSSSSFASVTKTALPPPSLCRRRRRRRRSPVFVFFQSYLLFPIGYRNFEETEKNERVWSLFFSIMGFTGEWCCRWAYVNNSEPSVCYIYMYIYLYL